MPARVAAPLWGQAPMRQTDTPGHEMPGKDGDLSRNGAREKTDGRKERTGQNGWSQVGSVEVIEGRDGKQSESGLENQMEFFFENKKCRPVVERNCTFLNSSCYNSCT